MWDDLNINRNYFREIGNNSICNAWVATAIVGSAVVGGAVSAFSASKAADAQVAAANTAAATQQRGQDIALQQYQTTRGDLAPFRQIGQTAGDQLTSKLSDLTAPITMDQATLEATPGYQFNKTQGLKAVQNSAAARGLGVSGAALKGAATFATGLADNTYQNQFNNAVTNQTNAFNRLKSLVDTGENAAAQTGVAATAAGGQAVTSAGQIAGSQIGAGNATAAGINATGAALSNSVNNIGGYMAYNGLYGGSNPTVPGATNVVGTNGNNPVPTF